MNPDTLSFFSQYFFIPGIIGVNETIHNTGAIPFEMLMEWGRVIV